MKHDFLKLRDSAVGMKTSLRELSDNLTNERLKTMINIGRFFIKLFIPTK